MIAVVAVIVFGDQLPQMARKAARVYAQMRNYMLQVRDEVIKHIPDEKSILPDLRDTLPPPQTMDIYMDPSDPDYKKKEDKPVVQYPQPPEVTSPPPPSAEEQPKQEQS